MEAFESFVAVVLEYENYVVSSGIKFPVAVRVNPTAGPTEQVHGFEVDLVGARGDSLVLATVKFVLRVDRRGFRACHARSKR